MLEQLELRLWGAPDENIVTLRLAGTTDPTAANRGILRGLTTCAEVAIENAADRLEWQAHVRVPLKAGWIRAKAPEVSALLTADCPGPWTLRGDHSAGAGASAEPTGPMHVQGQLLFDDPRTRIESSSIRWSEVSLSPVTIQMLCRFGRGLLFCAGAWSDGQAPFWSEIAAGLSRRVDALAYSASVTVYSTRTSAMDLTNAIGQRGLRNSVEDFQVRRRGWGDGLSWWRYRRDSREDANLSWDHLLDKHSAIAEMCADRLRFASLDDALVELNLWVFQREGIECDSPVLGFTLPTAHLERFARSGISLCLTTSWPDTAGQVAPP